MARNVFISFRYSDGHRYKDELAALFDKSEDTVDFSEDVDRSQMSDDAIQQYLYKKLRRSSVTIVILTPKALDYKTRYRFNNETRRDEIVFDDWIYDEVRYSLEEREGNATNGLIAVYTKESENLLFERAIHRCAICNRESVVLEMKDINNLSRRNMMNVFPDFKKNKCFGIYDLIDDSYCSFISYENFKSNFDYYIDNAFKKREELYKYKLCKRLIP